mgnify:CR=1 FL=1
MGIFQSIAAWVQENLDMVGDISQAGRNAPKAHEDTHRRFRSRQKNSAVDPGKEESIDHQRGIEIRSSPQ